MAVNQNKISKLTYNPKWAAILIVLICLSGMLLGKYVQRFRFSTDYRWIYQYGSYINLITVLVSVGISFPYPLIVWSNNRKDWKKNVVWMFIGFIPFLYFAIMMLWF